MSALRDMNVTSLATNGREFPAERVLRLAEATRKP